MIVTIITRVRRAVLATIVSVVTAASAAVEPAPSPEVAPGVGSASGVVLGADISWPNCPKGMGMRSRPTQGKPLPKPSTRFVVIGLTNGPAFHPNPCLASQVAWAKTRHLYVAAYAVATYPTKRQLAAHGTTGPHSTHRDYGKLFNTGYAQARVNVANMERVGLASPIVWVDVEPVSPPSPWSGSKGGNRAVVDGVVHGYQSAGYQVGFYSTKTLWRIIVGKTRYRLPEWRTAGQATRRAALARCRTDQIQGGSAVLTQWYDSDRDYDAICPGRPASEVLRGYFTKY